MLKYMKGNVLIRMNKQKNRYTPFAGDMRMPVNEFCEKYNLDLKVVMRRMNILYWEDYDALVVPQELEDLTADKIRRSLEMMSYGWSDDSIAKKFDISLDMVAKIKNLSDYYKKIFLEMDNYFFLNPNKIDLHKIFSTGRQEG